MDNVKTMVWESETFSISGETLFRRYDRQRREKEFELLKILSRDLYKTNDIRQDSIRIPVFTSDDVKVFTIQIKNTRDYYEVSILFVHEEDIPLYHEEYSSHKSYEQTLTEVEFTISNFLWNMSNFLRYQDLYFRDVTREEHEKIIIDTTPAYRVFERGDL